MKAGQQTGFFFAFWYIAHLAAAPGGSSFNPCFVLPFS